MPLDRAQIARLQSWTRARNVQARCPACGGTAFTPAEVVSVPAVRPAGANGARIAEPVAMVQLVCDGCAYVMLFAAEPIGLV